MNKRRLLTMMNVRAVVVLVLCGSLSGSIALARERGLVERAKDRARAAAPKVKALASKVVRKVKEVVDNTDTGEPGQSVGVRARAAMASLSETARAKGATQSPEKTSEWWESEGRGVVKGKVSQMLSESSAGTTPAVPTRSWSVADPETPAPAPAVPAPAAAAAAPTAGTVSGFSSLSPDAISSMPGAQPAPAAPAAPPVAATAPVAPPAAPAAAPSVPQQTSAAPPTSGFSNLGGAIRPAQPGSSVPQPAPVRASSGAPTVPPGSEQISGYPTTTKPSPTASPAPAGLEPVWTAASGSRPEDVLAGQAQIPGTIPTGQVQLMSAQRGRKPKTQPSPKPAAARKGAGK